MGVDVVALGELLIDFTENGISQQGNSLFEANPGGAPGNVLAMLAQLSCSTAFIGKVGDDMFGELLIKTLNECGINADGVEKDAATNTTLAFVKNGVNGERTFSFFRNPGADTRLSIADIDADRVKSAKCFHFGSLSLTHQPACGATKYAVSMAKEAGVLVSFDPNLRPLLWQSLDVAKEQIAWGASMCDVIKMSDDELLFLTKTTDVSTGVAHFKQMFPNVTLIFVTKGEQGSEAFYGDLHATCPALKVDAVDTTGAGDTFYACCLSFCVQKGICFENEQQLVSVLRFANTAAALVTQKRGAIRSMPTRKEIEEAMI
ncbi:MAG: PfkB family carbohydrate kinase [Lachnospiraceae bacterium]|jgi:fructokinase|nr:PfkB family carbohydrate kinase [Lachnospiraceae bacterium]